MAKGRQIVSFISKHRKNIKGKEISCTNTKHLTVPTLLSQLGGLKQRFTPLSSKVSISSIKMVVNGKKNAATYKPWTRVRRQLGHLATWGLVSSVGTGKLCHMASFLLLS